MTRRMLFYVAITGKVGPFERAMPKPTFVSMSVARSRFKVPRASLALVICGLAVVSSSLAVESIPDHRARQIYDAAPLQPQVPPQKPRRVLIWNTPEHLMEKDPHKGYCIPYGSAALETMGKKSKAFRSTVSDDLSVFLPENIKAFDAIVLNNASGPWITPTQSNLERPAFRQHGTNGTEVERVLRQSLLDFVAGGGGIVCLHYAIAANAHWPEFKELLGGSFLGHPWNEEIAVAAEEPSNPLLAAFSGRAFRLADEIYEYGPPYDRAKLRVLLSLDPAHSNMGVKWIHRKDNDFALAWVKSFGQGRVFNTSFGHRTELFWDPRVLQFYLDGIQFATGDLALPAKARADLGSREIPGTQPAPGLPGFVSLCNGRDLAGWEGDTRIWTVQDGAITGQTTSDLKVTENNFLLWKDEIEDFELRLKYRLEGGNSGIYYRANKRPPGKTEGEALVGAQADISADGRWTGVIMEYTRREILAERGQSVLISTNGQKTVVAALGDPEKLLRSVSTNDWNDYKVSAQAGKVTLEINGVTMSQLDDRDLKRPVRGWLGLQVHTGPPMRVQFKDIYLKRL